MHIQITISILLCVLHHPASFGLRKETVAVSAESDTFINFTCSNELWLGPPTTKSHLLWRDGHPVADKARKFQIEFNLTISLSEKRKLKYPGDIYEVAFYFNASLNGTRIYCTGDVFETQLVIANGVPSAY